ncbi:MAG: tetratricopeptide repeat protein [Spirochaetales bacterium]|nr:tetratricopeptide repeat protein [Spirochaetales bacterium]
MRDQENTDLTPAQVSEISELSKRGYQLLKESLTRRAVECFEQIIAIQPDNNYALVGIGDAYRKERRHKDAVNYYKDCLRYHPGNNYALFGLADCYKALGQFNRAIDIWEEYLKYDDSNVTVLTRIADAYRKVRNFSKSRDLYFRVLDMESTNSYALIGLGHLHYDFKHYDEALGFWQQMEEKSGDRVDIRVLTSIGNCYRKLKQFDKGVPYFERALEKQPGNFYALFGLADCQRGLNRPDQSLIHWNQILNKDPRNKVILTRAGDAYRNLGDLAMATRYYNEALHIEFDTYAMIGLALVAKAEGDYDNALATLEELIPRDPKNARVYIETARCFEESGRKADAERVLNDFMSRGMHDEQLEAYAKKLQGFV